MPRKPKTLTKAEKAAATRKKKQELALQQLGMTPKKPRKKRKPMSEEQRLAAVERLKKARAARAPAQNSSIHESIRDLDEEHPLHPSKVKVWIKDNKQELSSMKILKDSVDWKERMSYQIKQNYINSMETYLRSGVWLDHRWGPKGEFKMNTVCIIPAFGPDGDIKRTMGTWYADINGVYGEEDDGEDTPALAEFLNV